MEQLHLVATTTLGMLATRIFPLIFSTLGAKGQAGRTAVARIFNCASGLPSPSIRGNEARDELKALENRVSQQAEHAFDQHSSPNPTFTLLDLVRLHQRSKPTQLLFVSTSYIQYNRTIDICPGDITHWFSLSCMLCRIEQQILTMFQEHYRLFFPP
jgi:hypothetical protein